MDIRIRRPLGTAAPWLGDVLRSIEQWFRLLSERAPTAKSYAVADVPDPALNGDALIFVSDEAGGPTLARSDGSAWRRMSDNAVIS